MVKTSFYLLWGVLSAVLALSACACSAEAAVQELLGTSAAAPVFLDCRSVSSTELEFRFSCPVRVVSFQMTPRVGAESIEEGDLVRVGFSEALGEGERYTAEMLVEDEKRNTLTVLAPFRARNSRLPPLLITELRTEYGKSTTKAGTKIRTEFVELFAQGDGNLGALRLYIASHSASQPVLEFPPIEVKAGEYMVIHLRTMEEEWADETGGNLSLSGGTDALESARDLWVPGAKKILHKNDLVYLLDQDDRIIDGVVITENPERSDWASEDLKKAAALFAAQGAWLPQPAPAAALDCASIKTATTKSVSRYQDREKTASAADWYLTGSGNASPGEPNKP
ncbi:MAG: hypothetical protein LBQ67_04275 [Treponema sp.]|jgi:hypothetical protein|nr:hypothetical protein [Treponema sp.]